MNQEEWIRTRPRPQLSGLHARPHLDPWPLCTDVACRAPAEVTWAEVRFDPDPPMYQVTALRCSRCEGASVIKKDDLAELTQRVAERLAPTSTYADVGQDIVDGLLSDVVEAVLAELGAEKPR